MNESCQTIFVAYVAYATNLAYYLTVKLCCHLTQNLLIKPCLTCLFGQDRIVQFLDVFLVS